MTEILQALLQIGQSLLGWLLMSLGCFAVLGKFPRGKRWMAWILGLRYYALGQCVDMVKEGVYCGVMELVLYISSLFENLQAVDNPVLSNVLSLAQLVLIVMLYVYRIRLFLRLVTVFGRRKRWLWLWILVDWLPMIIFGYGKKFRPVEMNFTEDWEAGTAPAELEGAEQMHRREMQMSGLSLDLRERTAKDFGKKRYLLKDIALDIPNGSFVLLLGGSGSGKTTLVNAIIGYEKADATVLLNGSDVYKDYATMKYRIGFVPQKNLIRGNDTVHRTIGDAAKLRLPSDMDGKERKSKMQEVMDLLGLSAGAEGLVSKKSGGQLRRISIAMELVTDPELFVLDEPDSGLDGVIAREIFTKLRAIADEGKIVIVITHTPDRVVDLFDKVIVLGRDSGRVGRLAFYGSPQEAREFFGKDTMEGVVMSVNRKEEGGDGLADECIERYAQLVAAKGGAAS